MYEYEPVIKAEDFADAVEPNDRAKAMKLDVARSTQDRPQTNQTDIRFCRVEKLWLETPGKAGPQDKSFSSANPDVETSSPSRWHFAPKEEEVKVCWELKGRLTNGGRNFANPVKIKIELFTRRHRSPLWVKTIEWKAGECPMNGSTKFNGDLHPTTYKTDRVSETIEWKDKERFPEGVLTVDRSPFKLKLSIIEAGDPRYIVARWIYFDVLVDSLELKWGDPSMLSKVRPDIKDPLNLEKIVGKAVDPSIVGDAGKKGYEELILEELKKANADPVDNVVHEIKLTSNIFSFQKKQDKENIESFAKNTDFDSYKELWGNGARIPLIVKAYIKKSKDGEKTDKVPEAMGKSQLLWDWEEKKADRWKEPLAGRSEPKTEPFLKDAFDKNAPFKPKADSNCPKEYGGKHGDDANASLVFPKQDPTSEFPYKVRKSKGRKWSSISSFGTGEKLGTSGVIFQPARFAGDLYKIKAYLHFDRYSDSEDDIQAPPPVQTKTCEFKVFRRINLISLRRGNPAKSPDSLETALKKTYLDELDMYVDVKPVNVDNNAYKSALKTAVQRVCKREHFPFNLVGLDKVPLVSRFGIEMDPPADSPAVVYRHWDTIKQEVASLFENRRMRAVNGSPTGIVDEDVIGQTSGKAGLLLKLASRSVLLYQGAAPITSGEQVAGQTSGNTAALNFDQTGKSFWGWRVQVASKTVKEDQIYEESIKVVFPDNSEVVVDYSEKSGLKRKLTADLSQKGKDDLAKGFKAAIAAFDERGSFNIVINARTNSSNAVTRHENVQTFLEGLLKDPTRLDRRAACLELLTTLKSLFLSPNSTKYQKGIALLLVGEIIWEYANKKFPTDEGIFLLHVPGRYSGYSLDIAGAGARPTPAKMPKVQGAFYPELTGDTNTKPLRTRDRGIAFIATVADSDGVNTKSEESIIKHELAHGLFLPHCANKAVKPQPESPKPHCHVKDDGCLMSYDLDTEHFCGMCMLRLRGWKWRAKFAKCVTQVQIFNGDDKTFLTATDVQYVNLPKEDKWVDPAYTKNKDRLGRKVKVKVTFDPAQPGDKCYVQILGHKDNCCYTDKEKGRKASFNISQLPADLPSGEFDIAVGPVVEGSRDINNSFVSELELPPSVGDRYKIRAWGDDLNPVESAELKTWRILYYSIIHVGNNPNAVPTAMFCNDIESVFSPEFTKLVYLGIENVASFPIDHEYKDIVIGKLRTTDNRNSAIPTKVYRDFEPHLLRFAFAPSITNCREVITYPFAVPQFGGGAPDVDVPLYQKKPPPVPDGFDYRRQLWIGLGMPYDNGVAKLLTVANNTWFISVNVKYNDSANTVISIAESKCTPIEPDPVNQPGRYSELRVKVDHLTMPIGATKGDIEIKALCSGGMKGGWARFGLQGGVVIPALDNKMKAQSHSKQMNSAVHETGHALGMVANPGETGLDTHATHYTSQGDHCWTGVPPVAGTITDGTGMESQGMSDVATCVMFGHLLTGPGRASVTSFCPNCKSAMRKIDSSEGVL